MDIDASANPHQPVAVPVGMAPILLHASFALLIVLGTLAAYDRVVVRPAQRVGVVDVGEVYRQKEAEFTLILTKAGSDDERQ
ncbi:MAG: hypothetical protein JNK74_29665, partial [Candidatus Hydrogenedentes bacterium]|nr:hypothetical protein [Candidatus Hydrogenedentota bacterium]